ncbi:MAG: sodium:solute symporter [Pirellulaceae bacterium]
MHVLDFCVLVGYFAIVIVIGALCSLKIEEQDDFFMGNRSFGKLLQTFAAFGAGTGANEPIQVGRTVWTSGLSGIWSVLMWLFVTPFYWNLAVWYRRLRHMTLADFFVERYESKAMGVAFTTFAFCFYVLFLSTAFSAISKVTVPLVGIDTVRRLGFESPENLKYLLVPIIATVTVLYGVLGGLRAAYWTDLLQGICIVALSLILIPFGLEELVQRFGTPESMTLLDGFAIMHDRVAEDYFRIIGGPRAGEFPLHFIVSLTLLMLVGVVVHPHMISVGGGSARTENDSRWSLVIGSFLKRFCTIGWALTGLIVLALMADNVEAARDPDYVWGIACREILGPLNMGLVGLMLASLLAALMSSADCYMLTSSALIVRNVYATYFNPNASEKTYIFAGRLASLLVIAGGAGTSLYFYDVFEQFKLTMELTIVFAAPFWLGMTWRRANTWAAWTTILVTALLFFVIPIAAPVLWPSLRTDPGLMITNDTMVVQVTRPARAADVEKRQAWDLAHEQALLIDEPQQRQAAMAGLGSPPPHAKIGEMVEESFSSGGEAVFWSGKVVPIGSEHVSEVGRKRQDHTVVITQRRNVQFTGQGRLKVDYLIYHWLGVDLRCKTNAELQTLRVPLKIIVPFLVMILVSLVTPTNRESVLNRFYIRMRTPTLADPDEDRQRLEASYGDPSRLEENKLFPGTSLEIARPRLADILGFLICLAICFIFVGLAVWVTRIGA